MRVMVRPIEKWSGVLCKFMTVCAVGCVYLEPTVVFAEHAYVYESESSPAKIFTIDTATCFFQIQCR